LSYDMVSPFADAKWRTSSYSNAGASCVEVRVTMDGVLVRDSKDRRGDRPVLGFDTGGWRSLVGFVG
jgi:hypothetical protein